jgi:peptidyl-tRNA hydrolase, PTH2 family
MTPEEPLKSVKQVIVIRKDLKMRRGKEIAQGAHASMMFMSHYFTLIREGLYKGMTEPEKIWQRGSFAKICLKVNSEQELDKIFEEATKAGLKVNMVTDAGRTEFHGVPTKTCLAIGPDYEDKIDQITGALELY